MDIIYRKMTAGDLVSVLQIWKVSDGIGLSASDEVEELERFLRRNPGFSFIAAEDDEVVGALLCGHDGRRGYLHHLVVRDSHRRRGIGSHLVDLCLQSLRKDGIMKCHLFIFRSNEIGADFWKQIGWKERTDISMMSTWLVDCDGS